MVYFCPVYEESSVYKAGQLQLIQSKGAQKYCISSSALNFAFFNIQAPQKLFFHLVY